MQHESRTRLTDILKRTGHVLVAEDFDDILELDSLAAKVSDPAAGIDSPLRNHAVFFRGTPVFPLTLAHLVFLDECRDVLDITDDEQTVCMLWVSTQERITDDHYDGEKSRSIMRAWARHCQWTEADINAIMALRYGKLAKDAAEAVKDEADSDCALIGMLSREYGEGPRYWMWEAPIGTVEACVADWNRQQEAQATAYRKSAKGSAVAPPASPKFAAMRKLRECAERIEAKWQKSAV